MNKKNNKKAVSLMMSYVILISIGIALSLAVFIWLKAVSDVTPVADCEEGTSLILEDSQCNGFSINLTLKNNGRFSISGILVSVGDNPDATPVEYLFPKAQLTGEGFYLFSPVLRPGDTENAVFEKGSTNLEYIRIVQIQPFIIDNRKKVFCSEAVIKQEIPDCLINSEI